MQSRLFTFVVLMICMSGFVRETRGDQIQLTIYNVNLGLVKEERQLNLTEGLEEVRITDIASKIDPGSVSFCSPQDPSRCVLKEQVFVSAETGITQILDLSIGQEISLVDRQGNLYRGVLKGFDANKLLVQGEKNKDEGLSIFFKDNMSKIGLPQLEQEIPLEPALLWQVSSSQSGPQPIEFSYLTEGLNWRADYTAVIAQEERFMDIQAWATVDNYSGAAYKEAEVKLIAGDPQRVTKKRLPSRVPYAAKALAEGPEVKEEEFFEYHLYTLPGKITLGKDQTKQIRFIQATDIETKKCFVFEPTRHQKVKVVLEFENDKDKGLGIPLPKGKVQVYKKTIGGGREFLGEQEIDHLALGEEVRIHVGDAFDIIGSRKELSHRKITQRSWERTYEVSLHNSKEEDVTTTVIEHFQRYGEWEIIKSTHEYEKKDAFTVEFTLAVAPEMEVVIKYTIRQSW